MIFGGRLAVVAAAILFGTTGTARDLGPDTATSFGVGGLRIAVGAVGLWVLAARRRGGERSVVGAPTRSHLSSPVSAWPGTRRRSSRGPIALAWRSARSWPWAPGRRSPASWRRFASAGRQPDPRAEV